MQSTKYTGNLKSFFRLKTYASHLFQVRGLLLLIVLYTAMLTQVKAQDIFTGEKGASPLVYEETPVNITVEGLGTFYLDILYTNEKVLFVNVEDLFKLLHIPCLLEQKGEFISGFIENENRPYSINYSTGLIKVGASEFNPARGLIKEEGAVYMESSLFSEAFGIKMTFNYRALSIQLKTTFELPIIKQMRIEKMRTNISKVKGETIADTVVKRNFHVFKFGTLDWAVGSAQTWGEKTINNLRLGVGTELLFGEADIAVNYYNRQKLDSRQLQYIWRWVDNDKRIIKQAQVGKISTQSIAFVGSPVIGAVIRNSPTSIRKASGFYTINEHTEPNWTVELYINNVLVDYTKADASGLFLFKVPIVYGFTTLKMKFYGPLGEERTEERTMNIPYTFMPAGEFEYGLSAGLVQDSSHSRKGNAEFNYGVSRFLTVGGGMEYLSSIASGPFIPFAKASLQPFSKLTLNAEYAYGVRSRALVNYYFGKSASIELDYVKYVDGQRATLFNAPEERKIRLSLPFRVSKISGYAKIDYTQLVYSEFQYNQSTILLSVFYRQISANSTTQLNWIGKRNAYITTDLSLSFRLQKGIVLRTSARYNATEGSIMNCKAEVEKRIPSGYISISYEKYISNNDHYINLNFRYDLPFARTNIAVSQSKAKVHISESAQGSLAFGGNKYSHVSNNSSVSKGGILLYPFLDLNRNGIFDKGEHMVKLSSVKINGGRPIISEKDSIVRIPDLNAFINYKVEFSDQELENISWRFQHKVYSILVDPNQFKRVDIPVIAVGEMSGMAYMEKEDSRKGIGRITVKLYKKNSNKVVAETLSESDGYINYMGLAPGEYTACIDSVQLSNLDFTVEPPCRNFTIKPAEEGDIVEGIDFILREKQNKTDDEQISIPEPVKNVPVYDKQRLLKPVKQSEEKEAEKIDSSQKKDIQHVVNKDQLIPQPSNRPDESLRQTKIIYRIQLLASKTNVDKLSYFAKLQPEIAGSLIEETLGADGYYRYTCGAFSNSKEANRLRVAILKSGWKQCFIVTNTIEKSSAH